MRIKPFITALLALLLSLPGISQIFEPVKWEKSVDVISEKEGELVAKATIDAGWHVYATSVSNDPNTIGPIPTSLTLEKSSDYKVSGKVKEGKFITHFDPNFEMDLNYFENTATFRQRFSITSEKAFRLKGKLEYMACNDERCIFPEPESIDILVTPKGGTGEAVPQLEEAQPADNTGLLNPVQWIVRSEKVSDNVYDIVAIAAIEKDYHVYSAIHLSDGPLPLELLLTPDPSFKLTGTVSENPEAVKHYDKDFGTDVYTHEGSVELRQRIEVTGTAAPVKIELRGMACKEVCTPFPPTHFKVDLNTGSGAVYDPFENESATVLTNDPFDWSGTPAEPYHSCGQTNEEFTLWSIFIFGLIGGLLALLTPCVFPMIPLTVSFFTKGAEGNRGKKRAILYGFSIILIYFILSLPFHLSKNVDPDVLNSIATNVWLNVAFFIVFVVFAISFFGFFEITLPSSFANKVDNASNLGGAVGIFFMALTLAIVSFSCTGPILGTVIGKVYSEQAGLVGLLGMELSLPALKLTVAMLGFGIALGLPFGLFAAFPGLLKKLPKSGGWLQDFKVSLGFVELAFAIKFISNADLVQQWGIIKREVFIGLWIIIGVLWVLYLLKRFAFKKGYRSTTPVRGFKLVMTVLIAAFTIRLIPGILPPSELSKFAFLSGFPPPGSYSFYPYEEEFKIYHDLAEGMEVAKRENKPLFVDFTGWACVNCRKMEENMWTKESVKSILANDYVMVSLYVDEQIELPEAEQILYETRDGRKTQIKTVGKKWSTLQIQTFESNSQPMYAIISPDSTILTPIEQYQVDEDKYVSWLNCGLSSFENWQQNKSASAIR